MFEFCIKEDNNDQRESAEEKKNSHNVQENDYVLVAHTDPVKKSTCYFLGIIHTLKEKLLIIKSVIDPERARNDKNELNRYRQLEENAEPS